MQKFTLLILIAIVLYSCAGPKQMQESTKNIWINSSKVRCEGEDGGKCLQYQEGAEIDPSKWQVLNGSINGFTFQQGNIYKLSIVEKQLNNGSKAKPDISIVRTLNEVLIEKRDTKMMLHDIWVLYEMGGKVIDPKSIAPGNNRPQLEINLTTMRIMGNDGCNEIMGKINLAGETRLEIGTLGGTKKLCPDTETPQIFKGMLKNTRQYRIEKLKLALMDQSGNVMMRFQKVD